MLYLLGYWNSQRWLFLSRLSPGAFRGEGLSRLSPELLERNSQYWMFLRGPHSGELGEVGPGFPGQGRSTNLAHPWGVKTIHEEDGFRMEIRGLH